MTGHAREILVCIDGQKAGKREQIREQQEHDTQMLTPDGWKPAKFVKYQRPNPPLWAKPLLCLFELWHKYKVRKK